MTRTMYDSTEPSKIPSGATMVAGYVDGKYANMDKMKTRFPHSKRISIAISRHTKGQVLDVEPNCCWPPEGAIFWCTHTMAGTPNNELTVYCNTSTWPQVRAEFHKHGVSEPNYWVAHYDGVAQIPAGAIAKQYQTVKNTWDKSVVVDFWPGVDGPSTEPGMPPAAQPEFEPFPGASFFHTGQKSPIIAAMHDRLIAEGCNRYQSSTNTDVWGSGDVKSYAAWQEKCGFSGNDANGIPGESSWVRLHVPNV
ncbi:peptidoglycan-binding protein [Streptomyces sp. NRRL S-646]|uniref:peptidoglycan-binding protein n=1 Tax=Streptomyces sp. NRRL S-646 TaxID=1463917 RepID=UPI000A9D8F92|nr:peptidoglycan-binding protein [Streptomyces sp. NRRL S-646]